ncbi:SDR family NAD(P)-dependent oxidoreductase [Nocardia sp. 2]|uniref:SDR family NAD(P)-dependent oxidoreductase n=1 Tax=Nocardia acididurans TaxID=2802282 RepID=A0ABS1M3R4_9NOCA|nr:SDR family NAD(P)-dependent oxidoreductase [Nocardia acididurans]MBL1075215.1 SDR family NAD(P)-dependent oxidoreductase [Nocardia acididurans]
MSDRVVLITGTSTGIGLAVAAAAVAAGYRTVATLRNPARGEAVRATGADVRQLDVTDPKSVADCVSGVVADYGRLDAVINNAGASVLGTVENLDMSDIRRALEVNFFGVVEVTRTAMPHLRASGGRVVTVTSVGGVVGQPFNEAYCAAKFAVEGFMESLAPVAATVGVGVAVVEPGAVTTEFVANAGIDPARAIAEAGPYAPALRAYIDRTLGAYTAGQTAEDVAAVIMRALTAEPIVFRWQTSDWARDFVGAKLGDLDGSAVQGTMAGWVS